MSPACVLLSRGDQPLQDVSIDDRPLGIGRALENELVLDDPAVSRRHARILRRDDRIVLEDLASANGCSVNGERIEEEAVLSKGDEIRIGPYRLVLVEGQGVSVPLGGAAELGVALGPPEISLPGEAPEAARGRGPEEPVALRGLGDASDDPALPASARAFDVDPDEAESPSDPHAGLHAGLVLQRRGRLVRVLSWERDRLCVGRAPECDIVLNAPSVSRRHALLVRQRDGFEVWDLESANGTRVNGERVSRECLSVDDVIAIGEYQLTLLIDTIPIEREVVAEVPTAGQETPGESRFDMTVFGAAPAEAAVAKLAEVEPHAPKENEQPPHADLAGMVRSEAALATDEPVAVSAGPVEAPEPPPSAGPLVLELVLRSEQLPAALRQWLTDEGGELRLPVELRLRPAPEE